MSYEVVLPFYLLNILILFNPYNIIFSNRFNKKYYLPKPLVFITITLIFIMPEDWNGFPMRKEASITAMDNDWVQRNLGIESGQS